MTYFQKIKLTLTYNPYISLFLYLLLVFLAFLVPVLYARRKIPYRFLTETALLFTAGCTAGLSAIFIDETGIPVVVSLIAVLLILFNRNSLLSGIKSVFRDILFLLAAYILMLLWFGAGNRYALFVSMLITVVSSALSAVTGRYYAGRSFKLTSEKKSYTGSAVFFFSTVIVFALFARKFLYGLENHDITIEPVIYFGLSVFVISIILTVFEALSSKGTGKFILPAAGTLLIVIFFNNPSVSMLSGFIIGMAAAFIVAVISYRLRFLTADGSAATFLLASFLFGLGGIKWSVPIMAFFLLSSILSKIRKKKNEEVEVYFEKTGTRDYMQVIANGGLGGILVILNSLYPNDVFYLVYVATLAAVCADTWATEIGTLKRTRTYNILNLKPIHQGTSGGISLIGSLGAVSGALVISLSAVFWIQYNLFYYLFIIIFAGTAGSFFDSFLGATIQAQNKCSVCDKITEKEIHCGEKTDHFKGLIWMNNDLVNLLAGFAGGLIILIINGL